MSTRVEHSIEIRLATAGECKCPGPYGPGETPTCHHWWECDWGTLEHGDPRPDRGEVGHLMLITPDHIDKLAAGPTDHHGGTGTLTRCDDRTFVHLDYNGNRWTWELHKAHFWDGKGPEIYIGRWPD